MAHIPHRIPFALLVAVLVAACGGPDAPPIEDDLAPGDMPPSAAPAPQQEFWANLEALCGKAFRGGVTDISAVETDFSGEMIMHVRRCDPNEIQIPLHVGEDRSRTWILTRTAEGIRLKHDHRHADGSEDETTQYGGDTAEPGTPHRQRFPADAYTAELIPEAATNVWTIELVPGDYFTYQLVREGTDRRVRFTFELDDEVDPPPPPWGYEGT